MLKITNLTKSFISKNLKKEIAVNNISLTLENGIYGLLGPNGSGKTTILRCIMGIYSYKGEISIDSKNLKKNPECVKNIGYLPQQFDMFKDLTLYEMMIYFASLKGVDKNKRDEAVTEVLTSVNLEEKKNSKVKALSGGMKRRAGIAQALLGEPSLIILDEPTTGLDVEERLRFKNIISNISRQTTIILSTHIIEDVEALCDNIIIIKNGKVLADTDRQTIARYAENKVYEFELDSQPSSAEVEKIYEKSNSKYVKVLSKTELNGTVLEPTVEDGYLCYIKGI